MRIALPEVPGVYPAFVHHDCLHNQLVSINNRVCGVVPEPTPAGARAMYLSARVLGRQMIKTVEEDYYEMPNRYSGAKKERYTRATDDILQVGFDRKAHSRIKAFVKAERTDGFAKENPDPRMIQFRDPRFCVEVSRYLKPMEEHIYQMKGFSAGVPKSRNIAKGMNQIERAYALKRKMANFDDGVVVSLDASRFDKHVSQHHLKAEYSLYKASNPDEYFMSLLRLQLVNSCISTRGIKYKTKGKRMSGDMNTALGNCVIMLLMVHAFMKWCKKWDTLDDGDDILVIIERRDLPRLLKTVKPGFKDMGMSMKVENVADDLHQVVFCQSQIVATSMGLKFTRNPFKVMSCALTGVKYFLEPRGRANLIYSIGTCELILNLGVPVLQEYSLALLRNSRGQFNINLVGDTFYRLKRELQGLDIDPMTVRALPVTAEARDSFETAFGMSHQEQVALEAALATWEFTYDGGFEMPREWLDGWIYDPEERSEWYPLMG